MKPIAILCLGSAHGDDSVGWRVAEQLSSYRWPDVRIEALHNPGAGLLTQLNQYRRVLVVDACDCCAAAGSLFHYQQPVLLQQPESGTLSSHHVSLPALLQLARQLSLPLPPMELFAVQVAECQPMAELSPAVAAALPKLVEQISATVEEAVRQHV
ncbi:hydrogenase maturation protease [Pontibacter sp. JAM-7]|uniref:hydrogenase maturation protease n=1 Tax=Pontibacter sp. JAM-7 TaxID=3366581 RepID=UPI003AF6CB54